MRPQLSPLATPPSGIDTGTIAQQINIDFNTLMCYLGPTKYWKQCGTVQSNYVPDFYFQTGDFNNTSDKNQLRFLGNVDMNATLDVNGFTKLASDLNVDGNYTNLNGIDFNYTGASNNVFMRVDKNQATFRMMMTQNGADVLAMTMTPGGRPAFPNMLSSASLGQTINRNASSGEIYVFTSSAEDKVFIEDINNYLDINKYPLLQWKGYLAKDTMAPSYGLIAEEVNEIYPEVVITDNYGSMSVNYHAISIIGSAYQQQQNQKMETMKDLINLLAKEVCPTGKKTTICDQINDIGPITDS
jgi:hypothetical protein